MKSLFQNVFERNEDSLEEYGKTFESQLKTYLVECTGVPRSVLQSLSTWQPLDTPNWYVATSTEFKNKIFADFSDEGVLRIFSFLDAAKSDSVIEGWVEATRGLDFCWLTKGQLFAWNRHENWFQRGIGLRFEDGLSREEDAGNFSLKAWHGASTLIPGLDEVMKKAEAQFAVSSVRWTKRIEGKTVITAEAYNNGKLTINSAADVDEVLNFSFATAEKYRTALHGARQRRDEDMAPFELKFTQKIDPSAFSETVMNGKGPMKLWLIEIESSDDYRTYRGVDMHTWDRVFLDLGPDYAYLTIPGAGCVNAAPRLATIQGENNSGLTQIFHNGEEIFV